MQTLGTVRPAVPTLAELALVDFLAARARPAGRRRARRRECLGHEPLRLLDVRQIDDPQLGPCLGIDAPICQDGRSGGFTELLARAEVSHDALIDFPSEKAFKASDDVPFRPSIRPASDDIVDRRLVIAHTDHDGSMEGGVRVSVAAPIEAVSTGGHPGGGGDGTRAAELGKGGFRAFGIEGTGSYGAGLARAVRRAGHQVLEVNRGDRRTRRIAGKSDTVDAETAARSVLAGQSTPSRRPRTGRSR